MASEQPPPSPPFFIHGLLTAGTKSELFQYVCVRKEAGRGLERGHTDMLAAHLISPSLITPDG